MRGRPSYSGVRIASLSLILLLLSQCSTIIQGYKFALVPKRVNSIFFAATKDGCMDRAKFLSSQQGVDIECLYTGPSDFDPDGTQQAEIVQSLIDQGDIDGLSISILKAEPMRPVIQNAIAKGIPVVTFDSDDPQSGRASYIGTDNFFFGEQLGKVLIQIKPTGGNYMILSDQTPNVMARENGVRASLQQEAKTVWNELSGVSPLDAKGNYTYAIDLMRNAIRNHNVTAIVPVVGGPMFLGDLWTELVEEFPKVIFVVADGLQVQLDFLARGKVAGLVAQLPYNMGSMSMDSLFSLKTLALAGHEAKIPDFQGTNVLEHVMVPLILPDLTVNQNHLGDLKYIGFALFGVICLTSLFFLSWTFVNRSVRVVQAAQPGFLALVAVGVLIMGSSILPLSFDDSASDYTQELGDLRCMTIPWMLFIGFTLIFAALFAKLWRINHLFQSSARFKRVTLKATDVMIPMGILLTANAATLLWWTLADPLTFRRSDLEGTDAWNRVIATWGGCLSDDPFPYSMVLGLLNVGVMVVASWQAYRARKIKSEFAESKFVAMALVSMLQVSLIGMPLLVLVRNDPRAWYWTMSLMIFIICMVVLLVIFIPKMNHVRKHAMHNDASQRKIIADSIRQTQNNLNSDSQARGSQTLHRRSVPYSNDLSTSFVGTLGANDGSNHWMAKESSAVPSAASSVSSHASQSTPQGSPERSSLTPPIGLPAVPELSLDNPEPSSTASIIAPGSIKSYLGGPSSSNSTSRNEEANNEARNETPPTSDEDRSGGLEDDNV
ncbi:unnamed protein product [Cylindrotheca closterium]|uniref:G-protein coupled receptors family 3 profile domain-containing protein n=1 Tax=Cylindrotheca closterium TaxID=2856 RepID=A0AAD2JMG8_9STRA|nr:unnamed protein product [Cylindrotheca closterium]